MTVRSYVGEYGSSKARGGWIGLSNPAFDRGGGGVKVSFSLPIPKDASAHVVIQEDSFEQLALAMIASGREAAIKAFGAALHTDRDDALRAFGIIVERTQEAGVE
jgi:hypothetical protein